MLSRFWQLLSLAAPDLRDRDRETRLTRAAVWAILAGLLIALFFEFVLMHRPVLRVIILVSLVLALVAYWLTIRGRTAPARLVTMLAMLVAINTTLYTSTSGIHSVTTMLLPAVLVLASLLLGRRGFVLVTVLTGMSAAGLVVADIHNVLPTPYHGIARYEDIIGPVCILIFTALLVRLLAADLVRSVHRARRNEQALAEANATLLAQKTELERSEALLRETMLAAKRADEERQRLQSRAQQIQKLESLGMLAGGVAHDFNNLLMTILGNLGMAVEHLPKDSEVIGFLRDADAASRRAAELTRHMLAYSGRGRFVVERMNLNALVEEMAPMLRLSSAGRASITLSLSDDLPEIEADESQMRQVLAHLVTNAAEAIEGTGGEITINTGMADCMPEDLVDEWLHAEMPGGLYVWLNVADTGPGMDEPTLARIFDPFFTTKFTGRGLGLPAVLGIVRGHQGVIKVRSKPGKGTSFRVMLPAADRSVDAVEPEAPAQPIEPGTGTILLVDDEEAVRSIAALMLQRLGYTVLQAGDGEEALEIFTAHRQEIRGVVLDVTMPRMDGLTALIRLREMDPTVRVLMSSGFAEADVMDRAAAAGSFAFIQKPYEIRALADLLKKALA